MPGQQEALIKSWLWALAFILGCSVLFCFSLADAAWTRGSLHHPESRPHVSFSASVFLRLGTKSQLGLREHQATGPPETPQPHTPSYEKGLSDPPLEPHTSPHAGARQGGSVNGDQASSISCPKCHRLKPTLELLTNQNQCVWTTHPGERVHTASPIRAPDIHRGHLLHCVHRQNGPGHNTAGQGDNFLAPTPQRSERATGFKFKGPGTRVPACRAVIVCFCL